MCPLMPKIFIIWLFREKFADPCHISNLSARTMFYFTVCPIPNTMSDA